MQKKAKKRRQRQVANYINLEPTIDDTDPTKAQSGAARTLLRRIAESPLLYEVAGMRYGDFPLFHGHVNNMHQRMKTEVAHDGNSEIPTPELRKHIRRAEREMQSMGWNNNMVTQNGGPHLNAAMHAYVGHYAPLFAAKRASQMRQESLEEAKNYTINSRTPARTLGQLVRRKDNVGAQARAERARCAKATPTAARDIIHRHVMGGKKRPKIHEFEAAANALSKNPGSLARTLQRAAKERKKWDNIKQFHAKVRRQEKQAVAKKHKAEIDAIRAQVKAHTAKPKKPKAKGTTKAAKTLVPKATKIPKTKLSPKEKQFIARALTKAPESTTFHPVEVKPQERAILKGAKKRLAGANIKSTPSPGTLIPKQSTGREAQKRPPPLPKINVPSTREPLPEPKIIQQKAEIVRDAYGKEHDGRKYYLSRGGHINMWDDLHKDFDRGMVPPDEELPHHEHYKNDIRARIPSKMELFLNRKKRENPRNLR